ncbi:MAG: Fe2+-dependent dioxygenase [Pseudomonadota bacterium]
MIQIANVLSAPECDAIVEALRPDAYWISGAKTAGGQARQAKYNLQADHQQPAVRGALKKIEKTVLAHRVVKAYAQPDRLIRPMINRFDPGMAYGAHVDAPLIDGQLTDLSFTLFLKGPQTHGGGALIIQNDGSEDLIKLEKGHLVLYSAAHIHRVGEVTEGSRIAAVGWIKSRIASPDLRAALFEMEQVIAALESPESADARLKLTNARNRLIRLFAR